MALPTVLVHTSMFRLYSSRVRFTWLGRATKPLDREFIILVCKTLTERGIPLDRGHRDLNRLLEVRSIQDGALAEPQGTTYHQPDDEKHRIRRVPGWMQDETDTPPGK